MYCCGAKIGFCCSRNEFTYDNIPDFCQHYVKKPMKKKIIKKVEFMEECTEDYLSRDSYLLESLQI